MKEQIFNIVLILIEIIHLLIIFIIFIPFFFNSTKILIVYWYFLIFIYLGWLIFGNKCWLSIIEKIIKKKIILN